MDSAYALDDPSKERSEDDKALRELIFQYRIGFRQAILCTQYKREEQGVGKTVVSSLEVVDILLFQTNPVAIQVRTSFGEQTELSGHKILRFDGGIRRRMQSNKDIIFLRPISPEWLIGVEYSRNIVRFQSTHLLQAFAMAQRDFPGIPHVFHPRGVAEMTYFVMQDGPESHCSRVKIGSTRNLKQRLPGLQTGNPQKLFPIMVTNLLGEFDSQDAFAEHRGLGEWFTFPPMYTKEDMCKGLCFFKDRLTQASSLTPMSLSGWVSEARGWLERALL